MYINHEQCDIMQNESMKRLERPTSMTLQGDVRSSLLKTALYDENSENACTSNNCNDLSRVLPYERTLSRAFQECVTYGGWRWFNPKPSEFCQHSGTVSCPFISWHCVVSRTLLEYVLKLILSLKTRVLESTKTSSQWPSAHAGKLEEKFSFVPITEIVCKSGKEGGGMFVVKSLFCQMRRFPKSRRTV